MTLPPIFGAAEPTVEPGFDRWTVSDASLVGQVDPAHGPSSYALCLGSPNAGSPLTQNRVGSNLNFGQLNPPSSQGLLDGGGQGAHLILKPTQTSERPDQSLGEGVPSVG